MDLPDKYFDIKEVSGIIGVKQHVLRYWETEFPSIKPKKSNTGRRVYQKKDIELIEKVRRLLYDENFTIEGARKKLKEACSKQVSVCDRIGSYPLNEAKLMLASLLAEIQRDIKSIDL